jgi:SAM-dependent methyltransferase
VTAFADLPREPLDDHYGFGRGTPVDRRYVEAFLNARRDAIHGSVLEVQDNAYTMKFGDDRVSQSIVVDIDATNPRATLIADLQEAGSLAPDAYDCIILTQTLHLLRRPDRCIENCFRALRSGGALLATAPSVSRVSPTSPDGDFWRFTPAGIAQLFGQHWPSDFVVDRFGNLRTCVAFLMGEVVEDLPDIVLDHDDPQFPLTVAVAANKTSSLLTPPSVRAVIGDRSASRRSGAVGEGSRSLVSP